MGLVRLNYVFIFGTIFSKGELEYEGTLSKINLRILIIEEGQENNIVDILVRGKHAESCHKKLEIDSKVFVEARIVPCQQNAHTILLAERVQFT